MKKSILFFICFFIGISWGAATLENLPEASPPTRLKALEKRRDNEEFRDYEAFLATTEQVLSVLADPEIPSFSLEDPNSVFQAVFSLCRSRSRLSGRPVLFSGASLENPSDPTYLEKLQILVLADTLVAHSFRREEFYNLWKESVATNTYGSCIQEKLTLHLSEFQPDVPFDLDIIDRLLNTSPSRTFFHRAFHMQEIFAPPVFVKTFIENIGFSPLIRGWTLSHSSSWVSVQQATRVPTLPKMRNHPFLRIHPTLDRGLLEKKEKNEEDHLVVHYLLVPWVEETPIEPIKFRLEKNLSSIPPEVQAFVYQEDLSSLTVEARKVMRKRGACLREAHWDFRIERELYEIFLPLGDPVIQFHYAMHLRDTKEEAQLLLILKNLKQSADQGCPWGQYHYSQLLQERDPKTACLYEKLWKETAEDPSLSP